MAGKASIRQYLLATLFEVRGEAEADRTQVLLLIALTPSRRANSAHTRELTIKLGCESILLLLLRLR